MGEKTQRFLALVLGTLIFLAPACFNRALGTVAEDEILARDEEEVITRIDFETGLKS